MGSQPDSIFKTTCMKLKIMAIAVSAAIFLQACILGPNLSKYPDNWPDRRRDLPTTDECASLYGAYMNYGQSSDKSTSVKSLAALLLDFHDDLLERSKVVIDAPNDGIIRVAIWRDDKLLQEKLFPAGKDESHFTRDKDVFNCNTTDGIVLYRGWTFEATLYGWGFGTIRLHLNKSEDGSLIVREIKSGAGFLVYIVPFTGGSSNYYIFGSI